MSRTALDKANALMPMPIAQVEEALIGLAMVHSVNITRLLSGLPPDSFFILRNGAIWRTMLELTKEEGVFDFSTLCNGLETRGLLKEVGGPVYLLGLADKYSFDAEYRFAHVYAAHIAQNYRDRKIKGALDTSLKRIEAGMEPSKAASEALAEIGKWRSWSPWPDGLTLGMAASNLLDELERAAERPETVRPTIQLSIKALSEILPCYADGTLSIVAARPGGGKTTFLYQEAYEAALAGRHVLLFAFETKRRNVVKSIRGRYKREEGESEFAYTLRTTAHFDKLPFVIFDNPRVTPTEMAATCEQYLERDEVDLVVVDYIQLMRSSSKYSTREQEIASISRELKELAMRLDRPVLAAAQVSRAVENRADNELHLSDLRESGALEQDADNVLFLYSPKDTDMGQAAVPTWIKIAKQRDGPVGKVNTWFLRGQRRIVEPPKATQTNAYPNLK